MFIVPTGYTYIACFLTLRCNFKCPYCLNAYGLDTRQRNELTAEQWVAILSNIQTTNRVPITLEGGEPTLHPGFYDIVQRCKGPFDLLTNGSFDLRKFLVAVPPEHFRSGIPGITSIRMSWHPGQNDVKDLAHKCALLNAHGFTAGIGVVATDENKKEITPAVKHYCRVLGVDLGVKEYLPDDPRTAGIKRKCRMHDIVIGPNGGFYRCHAAMYNHASMLDDYLFQQAWEDCNAPYPCHPCDLKLKCNNVFDEGHRGAEIKIITPA